MNQELQKALAAWLQSMLSAAQNISGQIPSVLQEKILFGRIFNTVFWVVLLLGTVALARWLFAEAAKARAETKGCEDVSPRAVRHLFACLASVMGGIAVMGQTYTLVLVWFAPRVYLVNWLKGLL